MENVFLVVVASWDIFQNVNDFSQYKNFLRYPLERRKKLIFVNDTLLT